MRGSVLSVSRNSLGQENCLILKQFHCSPQTAMQGKLHDEVEGASRIGAGAQKADHVWMVHLYKRQHVWDCNKNPCWSVFVFESVSHNHTSMMAATSFRRVYSVIKKYVKKYKKKSLKKLWLPPLSSECTQLSGLEALQNCAEASASSRQPFDGS